MHRATYGERECQIDDIGENTPIKFIVKLRGRYVESHLVVSMEDAINTHEKLDNITQQTADRIALIHKSREGLKP